VVRVTALGNGLTALVWFDRFDYYGVKPDHQIGAAEARRQTPTCDEIAEFRVTADYGDLCGEGRFGIRIQPAFIGRTAWGRSSSIDFINLPASTESCGCLPRPRGLKRDGPGSHTWSVPQTNQRATKIGAVGEAARQP